MSLKNRNIYIGIVLVLIAATMKALTHPHSIDPIIAISLFSGAIITDRKLAFIMPLMAMFISDVILEVFTIDAGFYGIGQVGNYAALLFVTFLGFAMKRINLIYVAGFSLSASWLFFLLSNSNCYFFDFSNYYGHGFDGYFKCLAAGLPFVKKSLLTDFSFSLVLFYTYSKVFKTEHTAATEIQLKQARS